MRQLLRAILVMVPILLAPTHTSATSFDGGYVGVHVGFRWADLDLDTPAYQFPDGFGGTVQVPARSESYSLDGFIGGAHAGYNVVQSKTWLFGVEADIDFGNRSQSRLASFATARIDGTDEVPQTLTSEQTRVSSIEVAWQGTVRARFGYIEDDWLFYGSAGVAFLRAQWNETLSVSGGAQQTVDASELLTGWVIGAGIEKFVDTNAIARFEYLYEDFGSKSVPLAFSTSTGNLAATAHKVRIGVSWMF